MISSEREREKIVFFFVNSFQFQKLLTLEKNTHKNFN